MPDFTIKALASGTFDDFAALVERNGGMFAGCWCTKFHADCAEKGQSREGNRALKQRLVAEGVAQAALVYDGDRAVAWAQFGSPEELPDIHHRKEYLATAERLPDYRITCVLVEGGLRGQGLAAVALRGAVELIAQAGGGVVEGYPHDTAGVRKKNSSFLYNGTRTMYEREGFTYDRPKGQGNCVMVREVAPSTRGMSMVARMTSTFGFTPGQPPEWDIERFMRGDEIDTAVITLERNRRTFAWKCADVGAEGLRLRLGASSVTLGGLLKHLAWVEELYFQNRLADRQVRAPFDRLDLESDWDDWAWSTAADDTPDALRALWADTVHRSRDALAEALSRGGLEQTTPNGMSLRRLLADMIEEYARHTGHADLLREQVDGVTGEGAPPDFPVP